MAFLSQLTFSQLQQQLSNQYTANAAVPANTATGSALSAIFNAVALLLLQEEAQIAYVNGVARLATSTGADIDSFISPFGVTRGAAVAATGTVTFSTASPVTGNQLVIANGTTVQTVAGTQFTVIADTGQTGYSAGNLGYVIPVGQSSVNATVQCSNLGVIGNVQANTITQIVSVPGSPAPAGVNQVNNATAFTNGSNSETDSALVTRFQNIMSSRYATLGAVGAAVAGVQSGLTYQVGDQIDATGAAKPNFFSVVVNVLGQNSGCPQSVLTAVSTAVNNSRPVGVPYTVTSPTLVTVNASATLTLLSGSSAASVITAANNAISNYVNNIGLSLSGASTICSYSKISSALLAVTGVNNVSNLLVNGGTVDLTAPFGSQFVSGNSNTLLTQ